MKVMKKHAYLIIAHNHSYVLERLIRVIDDARNDIYLHIDAMWSEFDFEACRKWVHRSNIYFARRHNVAWGGYSLIETEIELFSMAYSQTKYSYYHLLSGTDLLSDGTLWEVQTAL